MEMVFSQFRSQYPQGSIVTEMLAKVDGLHTFRAIIKDHDLVLSTATAVDSDLETAEDRAIKRALTTLGITFESSYGIQATLMPQINQPALKAPTKSAAHLLESVATSTTFESSFASNQSANESKEQPSSYIQPKYTEKYEPEVSGKANKSQQFQQQALDSYADKYESPTAVKSAKPEQHKSEPIDLSSQLSQIMVEMERIGWTKQQGKDYLQRKYKKSSRDQLSASEVFDFLEYLQSQSDTF
ncbi:hypothetical protein Syn7502_02565 [Synechococcus sp. PCC 7502]|uniref:hypothetical protein n=1 Tax=Synechococcus sp. PCC 7502 TaxID=1173263 RepID=UPI00029FDD7A|nr:hypothetical protein [Synechococcus sp. PCC 7502]AFY74530.1 hypothetical protein Syn7502_02565 [Synechococcus sp. PCC 7502]